MKKNLLTKISYMGLLTIFATPIAMGASAQPILDDTQKSLTGEMEAAASEHDQKIVKINAEIAEIDNALEEKKTRLAEIKTATEKGKDSVRTLVENMYSPARPRGVSEPSGKPAKSGGLFGGWDAMQISNLWNWAEFLYNNKEHWKKQAALRAKERDAAHKESADLKTLLSEVFSLEAEILSLQQTRVLKCELLHGEQVSALREQVAKLQGENKSLKYTMNEFDKQAKQTTGISLLKPKKEGDTRSNATMIFDAKSVADALKKLAPPNSSSAVDDDGLA